MVIVVLVVTLKFNLNDFSACVALEARPVMWWEKILVVSGRFGGASRVAVVVSVSPRPRGHLELSIGSVVNAPQRRFERVRDIPRRRTLTTILVGVTSLSDSRNFRMAFKPALGKQRLSICAAYCVDQDTGAKCAPVNRRGGGMVDAPSSGNIDGACAVDVVADGSRCEAHQRAVASAVRVPASRFWVSTSFKFA